VRDGDSYVVNGQKTFISNGQLCDLVIVCAKTNPEADPPHAGVSLIVVEGGTPGFEKGRNLEKMGLKAQDTSELHFTDCVVPRENLLGEESGGFKVAMKTLDGGRIGIAAQAVGIARASLEDSLAYAQERRAFGQPLAAFQGTQWRLADMATAVEAARLRMNCCCGSSRSTWTSNSWLPGVTLPAASLQASRSGNR